MCTRKEAIQYIVAKRQGTLAELQERIGNLYDPFVTLGFVDVRSTAKPKTTPCIEWTSTDRAFEQQHFYDLLS